MKAFFYNYKKPIALPEIYKLLFLLLMLAPGKSFCASVPYTVRDTTIHPSKPYKINEEQFLSTYGKDDSSRALIRYYFSKRKKDISNLWVSGGIIAAAGILFLIFNAGLQQGMGFFIVLILASAGYVGALALIIGVLSLIISSRRHLYKLLQAYQQGKSISKHIRRKYIFRRLVKEEQYAKKGT